ncbi:MAG: hypothetical protein WC150_02060 [Bacteroidia bacterium]
MEQFLTGDIWNTVNKYFTKRQSKLACIAYVTSDNLQLIKGDTLICDASDYEIKSGATSAKVLDIYFKKGVTILSNQDLHSKLLLTNTFLVIGSANLSNHSAKTLVESAIVTNNDILLSQAKSFCHNLIKESIPLTRMHIDRILKIEVVKRPFKPSEKSATREKVFGNRYWYVPILEMSEKAFEKVEDRIENSKQKVTAKTKFTDDDLGAIYFRKQTTFSSQAKEGDQIMMNWQLKSKTRYYVSPFVTILRIDKEDDETIFIYDNSKTDKEILFSKFLVLTKEIDLEKNLQNRRTKELSASDAKKLKDIWK